MRRKGFLSSELALAMVVSLVLLSGVSYAGLSMMQNGKIADAKVQAANIGSMISQYKMEVGAYPTVLTKLTQKEGDYKPLMTTIPKDPWGRDYMYQYIDDGFVIYSRGRDGQSHGSTAQLIKQGDIGFTGK